MKQILCFGDSNTWGYNGENGERFPWGVRWTGLLQEKFAENRTDVRIIEEGLVGRTTVFEDPLRDGRKGTALFPTILETHAPVDVIVLMLGTNDCKTIFKASAKVIGAGIVRLLEQAKRLAPEAEILLVSPIELGADVWREEFDPEFSLSSVAVSKALASEYADIAGKYGCTYLDAASVAVPGAADQEHMDAASHGRLAEAIYEKVKSLV